MASCSWGDIACGVGNLAEGAIDDAIENMANAVLEAFGKAVTSVGTLWVNIGTPNLTGAGGGSPIEAGTPPPNSVFLMAALGYASWIAFAIAGISIIILGALVATRIRRGEGVAAVGRIGIILGAVILISGAGGFVSALLPTGPTNAGGSVLFLQSALWWYTGAVAVLSIILGGVRMIWEQRAEPGRETIKSLLTLIVVSGAGVSIVGFLVVAFDSFSVWIINGSLECDVAGDGACFGENLVRLISLTSNPATLTTLGPLLIIILGTVGIIATMVQVVLMVARGGMLVILAGILPLSASATNTEMGKSWFKKNVGWLIAFILYKPAAAIVYATSFQLLGSDVFVDDGTGFLAVVTGLMLMVLALFAMPALMRFVTPLVGSMAAGTGGALAMGAAMAALPSGAAAIGRLSAGSSGGGGGSDDSGSGGGSSPSGSTNTGQSSTPSADNNGSSSSGNTSGAASTGTGAKTGATSGGAGGGTATAGGTAGGGAAAGGAAGGGAAAGGAAGGGAAAGAAGGPIGMAAGAAFGVAKGAADAAKGAAEDVGNQATGEGSDE